MVKNRTRQIVISGLLVAIAFIIPIMIQSWTIPEYSATPFAHVPLMIAMFINPTVAGTVALGTSLSFFIKFAAKPIVGIRALTHLLFALVASVMLKKSKSKLNVFITYLVTLILHVGAEALVVALWFGLNTGIELSKPLYVGIGIFSIHHTFDFLVTVVIYFALKKAKVINL